MLSRLSCSSLLSAASLSSLLLLTPSNCLNYRITLQLTTRLPACRTTTTLPTLRRTTRVAIRSMVPGTTTYTTTTTMKIQPFADFELLEACRSLPSSSRRSICRQRTRSQTTSGRPLVTQLLCKCVDSNYSVRRLIVLKRSCRILTVPDTPVQRSYGMERLRWSWCC